MKKSKIAGGMKTTQALKRGIVLMEQMIDVGGSIREKIDKRGYHGALSALDMLNYWDNVNKDRTFTEVIEPMKRFITLFEELEKVTG